MVERVAAPIRTACQSTSASTELALQPPRAGAGARAREPYARFVDTNLLDELERDGFFTRLERQYPATERRSATVP